MHVALTIVRSTCVITFLMPFYCFVIHSDAGCCTGNGVPSFMPDAAQRFEVNESTGESSRKGKNVSLYFYIFLKSYKFLQNVESQFPSV